MNIYLFAGDNRPAALCLDPPHGRHTGGKRPPHAVAMGGLIEPVLGGDRPDLYGLEQNVIAGITGHLALHQRLTGKIYRAKIQFIELSIAQ